MGTIDNIVIGVVSGVLTSALLYVCAALLRSHVLPWYQAVSYRGVDVGGTWVAELTNDDGFKAKVEIELTQHAHRLGGLATFVQGKDLSKPTVINNLTVVGSIWEGFLTLNMQSTDRKRLSFTTSLLEVANGGNSLRGSLLYRSIRADDIKSSVLNLRRRKD